MESLELKNYQHERSTLLVRRKFANFVVGKQIGPLLGKWGEVTFLPLALFVIDSCNCELKENERKYSQETELTRFRKNPVKRYTLSFS